MTEKSPRELSLSAVRRLPYYLKYLKDAEKAGNENVSSTAIAAAFGIYEVQVRKDLASVSSVAGKPRVGFPVRELARDIEHYLGYDNANRAVLVGAGHLGSALLSYPGFGEYGLEIVAAFDADEKLAYTHISGKPVLPLSQMAGTCARLKVHIGIITVPAPAAQKVCDQLIASGVLAIWNFAHVHLTVPDNILLQDENMALSFSVLSNQLARKLQEGLI